MNIMMHNSYILLNTDALRRNVRTVLEELPEQTALIPVLKDDAYGLGLKRVAGVLMEFPRIRMLAISHLSEGVELREMGWKGEILVLGGVMGFLLPTAVEQELTVTVGRLGMVPELARLVRAQGKKARVQLKVETGLHRIGVLPGAEMDALQGMQRMIAQYKPKLAVCVYHKPEDLWEIPLYIHKLVPGYRLILRQHSSLMDYDTVLYAF